MDITTKKPDTSVTPNGWCESTGDPLWYKDAIIYQLHVKAFFDSNNDGIGDFAGLTQKLDYIRDLGVNTIWLLPFYPSPMLDDGYDVADYTNVHSSYGSRADFRFFVREAHRRGLKVITELVVNHTSDQHPWFQAARRAPPGSVKRNYYVWSDDPNRYSGTRIIFTDTESSNWAWDSVAQSHYWHRFFSHQPDLNFDNPRVLKAVLRVMRFWLDMGVDGFRLDAIPYLIEREGTNNENLPETHEVIRKIRAALDRDYSGRMLLAEANQWPEDVCQYFGNGDECHMAYHFPLMPRLFMSIAMQDRYPLIEIMGQTPDIPSSCQWAIFLRNHDELTLEMVTDRERDYMYRMFADDPRMRVNVGIRRRLAPLMQNSRPQIELLMFLLMTLGGAPILYYGDEIGMGDNIYLGDRNGVRTPMQWSPDRNAGFSHADPQKLYLPPVMDALYGYQSVNVEAQMRNSSSLLHWTRRLISVRRTYQAFSRGTLRFLEPGNRKILAYLREYDDETVLCVANLSRGPQAVELDLQRFEGRVPIEIVERESFPPIGKLPYLLTLAGQGYFAFRLATDAPPPTWHEQRLARRALPVLVLAPNWRTALDKGEVARDIRRVIINTTRERLRDEILLPYLRTRRWFAAKSHEVADLRLGEMPVWETPEGAWLMAILYVDSGEPSEQCYFFPLAIDWETTVHDPLETLGSRSLAKVRQKDRIGILYGAFGNPEFARALARAMASNEQIPLGTGYIRFRCTSTYQGLAEAIEKEVRMPPLEQSNTGIFFGNQLYLKGYRRLQAGINSEFEMGQFLTETAPYANIAKVVGDIAYFATSDSAPLTLALMQQNVDHQGDLWTFTLDYLKQYLATATTEDPVEGADGEMNQGYLAQMALLGERLAELHQTLAQVTGQAAFDPEPITPSEIQEWRERVTTDADIIFKAIAQAREGFPTPVHHDIDRLLASRTALDKLLSSLQCDADGLVKTRYHGDFHLGQILVTSSDFIIIDFEGEPMRSAEERRRKHCPLRDVAGLIRSLNYAGRAALLQVPTGVDIGRAKLLISQWETAAVQRFYHHYRQATLNLHSVPSGDDAMLGLRDLFLVEKALYELRYEMDNRPSWIGIPIDGLFTLINR